MHECLRRTWKRSVSKRVGRLGRGIGSSVRKGPCLARRGEITETTAAKRRAVKRQSGSSGLICAQWGRARPNKRKAVRPCRENRSGAGSGPVQEVPIPENTELCRDLAARSNLDSLKNTPHGAATQARFIDRAQKASSCDSPPSNRPLADCAEASSPSRRSPYSGPVSLASNRSRPQARSIAISTPTA